MPLMTWSPVGVTRTASGAAATVGPGAPFGHKAMGVVWARTEEALPRITKIAHKNARPAGHKLMMDTPVF